MTKVTDFFSDLLKRFAGNTCASLLLAGGAAFYAVSASALTVGSGEYGVPGYNLNGFLPASDQSSVFNNGTPAQPAGMLPSLGSQYIQNNTGPTAMEKQLATALKELGTTTADSDDPLRVQAETLALSQAAKLVQKETSSLLSPLGTVSTSLDMTGHNLDGSSGRLFSPLYQSETNLVYSQIGLQSETDATVGNFGLGQRFNTGTWMLGYNAFVDNDFDHQLTRGSLGAEAGTDYLRFSTNYYQPFSSYKADSSTSAQLRRQARGYDITTKGYLPFYRQLGASLSYEQYFGNQVDLFGNGTRQSNPSAVSFGVNYTPVPIVTVMAEHQAGQDGDNQDVVKLTLNYRLGVPLSQQLSSQNVAAARSLRGSRMDMVDRNNMPVMEFKQRKTLSVFLATPPWSLQPGETVPLKLQLHALNSVVALSWQGDTQALSLTPPANNRNPDGWSVIVPPWDDSPDATNIYHLSVTVEDSKSQKVTSNWITLNVSPPLTAQPQYGNDSGLNF
ncbi:YchO/YchP family invasin [Rahnella sp. L72c]|uniref:YchO/YchP family invasin n=1 Tax=Rahnella perminowiae TaxID=2816244 RepID=A0ABS6L2X8_9GAMM|nr:YchO/YchP family invasin [Rahnella perminowiae]MBU9836035.1 YchO/YchP family invasin [Rahnella perminowiae]